MRCTTRSPTAEPLIRLTYTEQGVHFDGLDSVEGREEGMRGPLANLGTFLVSATDS